MAENVDKSNRRTIVIAMDGSKEADNALDFYMKNIRQDRDDVILMHCVNHRAHYTMGSVWMPLNPQDIAKAIIEDNNKASEICKRLRELLEMYKDGGRVSVMKLEGGDPGETILKKAEECEASVIIVGSRGLGTIRRTILGSVSDYILHHAHVPVFICR